MILINGGISFRRVRFVKQQIFHSIGGKDISFNYTDLYDEKENAAGIRVEMVLGNDF